MQREYHHFSKCELNEYDAIELLENNFKTIKTNKKIEYYNVAASFDIETTSFYMNNEKQSTMYAWVFGINGICFKGRTWDEFIYTMNTLIEKLELHESKRLCVYVHNLQYEFQFFRKYFTWKKVFSMSKRKPIYALTDTGIEFRCSYFLSGYNLATLANLLETPMEKLIGDLDYNLIRGNKTELNVKEWGYIKRDCDIVMQYINEKIKNDGDITKIPLTKTGYVRNYCRKNCLKGKTRNEYARKIKILKLENDEYMQLKRAFMGGFTHANAYHVGKTLKDVSSYDFTSSYPYCMVAETFPMSRAEKVNITSEEQFNYLLKTYCCLFDIEFFDLQPKIIYENPLSLSRCYNTVNPNVNNGRIVSCDYTFTTITEKDFLIISEFYVWSHITVGNFRTYERGYLPKELIESILKLYVNKTTLKNIEGHEIEYLNSKEQINSSYGMMVTDICRDNVIYDNEWLIEKTDINDEISRYNKSKKRFLFYPWGVWVTANARFNLFSAILAVGSDYVYSDTDSVKILNEEKHEKYFTQYNNNVMGKLKEISEYYNIDINNFSPQNIKGERKTIGLWEKECVYSRFKTLGAKRYMTESDNKISLTVSGLNKKVAIPYMQKKYGDEIFDSFDLNLYFPRGETGKKTHTYLDDEMSGTLIDYNGIEQEYHEKSGIHLEEADYSLNVAVSFYKYLCGINENEYN